MPLIQINMMEGRTPEQKRALLTAITEAVHESIGAPIPSIRVWIHELEPDGFISGGQMASDRQAAAAAATQGSANGKDG